MSDLMKITLLLPWGDKSPGTVCTVDSVRGRAMIASGAAEEGIKKPAIDGGAETKNERKVDRPSRASRKGN